MTKRIFYGPKHRFAMLMNVCSFDKLCKLAGQEESLASYVERMIEREYQRRVDREETHLVPRP